MADPASPSLEVVPRSSTDLIMSDDELRRTYRLAEAMALSGAYKDLKNAEAALAKIVIGRDLGMTPAESLQGIHLVEGGVQMHYATLGQFIRRRDGYAYRPGWIKVQTWARVEGEADPVEVVAREEGSTLVRLGTGEVVSVLEAVVWEEHVLVWLDEEEPLDMRPTFGAVTEVTVDGERRGVSRFTEDDARQALLIKDNPKAAWNTSRRNMLLARSISNAVKWLVPEVLNGMPVYALGEVEERKSLTAPTGGGGDEGSGIDLGPQVEAIIARAEEIGHRGLSNRGMVELAVGKRSPGVVKQWVAAARVELERFAAEKAAAEKAGEGEGEKPEPVAEKPVEAPPEEVSGQPVPETETERADEKFEEAVLADEAAQEDDPQTRIADVVEEDREDQPKGD